MKHWILPASIGVLLLSGCESKTPSTTVPANNGQATGNPHASLNSAGGAEAAGQLLDDAGGDVTVNTIALTPPAVWQRKQPNSSIIAAEFSLPRAEGDDADGRLTVSSAGGSIEANIDRWKAQFNPLSDEKPLETADIGGMNVTIVDLSGDFNDARGPFAPPVPRSGYRMIGGIVADGNTLYFIKATGPQKTMAAHTDEIDEFIRSVHRAQ